jgi:hypothetical protein
LFEVLKAMVCLLSFLLQFLLIHALHARTNDEIDAKAVTEGKEQVTERIGKEMT